VHISKDYDRNAYYKSAFKWPHQYLHASSVAELHDYMSLLRHTVRWKAGALLLWFDVHHSEIIGADNIRMADRCGDSTLHQRCPPPAHLSLYFTTAALKGPVKAAHVVLAMLEDLEGKVSR
jgi:hypothetical protein